LGEGEEEVKYFRGGGHLLAVVAKRSAHRSFAWWRVFPALGVGAQAMVRRDLQAVSREGDEDAIFFRPGLPQFFLAQGESRNSG
jgi:hypothetical protein